MKKALLIIMIMVIIIQESLITRGSIFWLDILKSSENKLF